MAKNTSFRTQATALQALRDHVTGDTEGRYTVVEFDAIDAAASVIVRRVVAIKGLSIQTHEVLRVGQRGAVDVLHTSTY